MISRLPRLAASTVTTVLFGFSGPAVALVIDSFDGNQMAVSPETSEQIADVLGGERDLHTGGPGSSVTVDNGTLTVRTGVGGFEPEGWIVYDGIDDSPTSGLGGFDLTGEGMHDAFSLAVDSADNPFNIRVWVFSDAGTRIFQSPILGPIAPGAPQLLIFLSRATAPNPARSRV